MVEFLLNWDWLIDRKACFTIMKWHLQILYKYMTNDGLVGAADSHNWWVNNVFPPLLYLTTCSFYQQLFQNLFCKESFTIFSDQQKALTGKMTILYNLTSIIIIKLLSIHFWLFTKYLVPPSRNLKITTFYDVDQCSEYREGLLIYLL